MNCKKNANSNPGEERQLFHPESEKVVEIGLERLRPFKNHPFKVKEDEAMAQLMESIERYGILNPLIVMPTREGVYQIVSGHRRKYCAEKLGYTQVPTVASFVLHIFFIGLCFLSGRHGFFQTIFPANAITEFTNLVIVPLVGNILVVIYKICCIEN